MSMTDLPTAMQSSPRLQPVGHSRLILSAGILAVLMLAASVFAITAKPSARATGRPPAIVLETAIPRQFGEWRELPQSAVQVVNPQTQELLDKLYSQTLSRTYINGQGQRVMLSLAYGDDQRGGLQAHMPEVCYPAQGFTLHSASEHLVKTPFGDIPGKRLTTSLGSRQEPITYWFALGDRAVGSRCRVSAPRTVSPLIVTASTGAAAQIFFPARTRVVDVTAYHEPNAPRPRAPNAAPAS